MDTFFLPLASLTGASLDQVKLITCLLVAYPLGSLFIRIPSSRPGAKHLFSISVAFIYLIFVFKLYKGTLQLVASVLGTYVITKHVRGPRMPWIVFVMAMAHLMLNHIIRVIYNTSYETVEVTGAQMVLTMKLTTFAWNVWDGRRPSEDLDKWQATRRVTTFPSLLEFFGYAFYFPGILVGPYIEFAEYMALIDESLFKLADGKTKPGRAVPQGRKRVAYVKLLIGLANLGIFVVLGGSFNFMVALMDWFADKPLLYRIGYYQICGTIERTKYYAIWTLTEGASILTGFGFTGFTPSGDSLWEGAANVNVRSIEIPPNFKVLLDSWNIKTNVWLRECIYKRVTPKGKKPGFRSSMITFATSAFWHGIAGGYYLTFLFGGFVSTAARLCRSNLRPLVLPPAGSPDTLIKRAYDVLGTVATVLIMNFTTAPFMLLNVRDSLFGWQRLGWYGIWMVGGALVFFYAGGQSLLKGMRAVREEKSGVGRANKGGALTSGMFQLPPSIDGLSQK